MSWLAADFDGHRRCSMRSLTSRPREQSRHRSLSKCLRSGAGAHAWLFFSSAVPAVTARQIGTSLLREAIALRGRMNLSSYDRLFPSQDVLQTGGPGNLIAAPLSGRARRRGATMFLDLATLEPYDDQWAYLSTLGRLSRREADRFARRLGQVMWAPMSTDFGLRPPTKIAVRGPAHGSRATGRDDHRRDGPSSRRRCWRR